MEKNHEKRFNLVMDIGRNDLCPCGSGKKYKKCCLNKQPSPRPVETSPSPVEPPDDEYELVVAGDIGDYGAPRFSKKLFDALPSGELSAYSLIWNMAKQPEIGSQAEKITRRLIFKAKFPHRDYWKGPLTGLADIKYRHDHPIVVPEDLRRMAEQSFQRSGITVSSSDAEMIMRLIYTRRVIKVLQVLTSVTGEEPEKVGYAIKTLVEDFNRFKLNANPKRNSFLHSSGTSVRGV